MVSCKGEPTLGVESLGAEGAEALGAEEGAEAEGAAETPALPASGAEDPAIDTP